MWELDHIFALIEPDGPEITRMADLGFTESYRRDHPGQGTSNVCYAFDNLYVELIWITDPDDARTEPTRRTGLYERSQWRTAGTCPLGIAFRPTHGTDHAELVDRCWDYRPQYLPPGPAIRIAVDSDDPHQPMMFYYPGSSAPTTWGPERRGQLQHPMGFGAVVDVEVETPAEFEPSPALRSIQDAGLVQLRDGEEFSVTFAIQRIDSPQVHLLRLPEITLTEEGQPRRGHLPGHPG